MSPGEWVNALFDLLDLFDRWRFWLCMSVAFALVWASEALFPGSDAARFLGFVVALACAGIGIIWEHKAG